MIPFNYSEHTISPQIKLTIIDIVDISESLKKTLDEYFVLICEGNSGSDLATVKTHVKNLFSTKNMDWVMGAIAEFFVHLYIRLSGYKQECLFLNLEENSIKKGFDGLYSKGNIEWLMESKAGSDKSKKISHARKVTLAMNDLALKVSGRDTNGKKKLPNNPWREAYAHASQYDVGTVQEIRKNIKRLSNDFTNGIFHSIEEFNTMPCGTIFLSGTWIQPDHNDILNTIIDITDNLKGQNIHVICTTQRSIDIFMQYIDLR